MLQIKNTLGGGGGFYPSVFVTGLSETDTVSMTGEGKTYTPTWTTKEDGTSGWLFEKIKELGTYTITASNEIKTITETVVVDVATEFNIEMYFVKIVSWTNGTDEEIANMVAAADAGMINLTDYWAVGDERSVSLSAMSATGVGESHVAQTVTMVLMNAGGKTIANATPSGRTTCSFIVGMKNGLANGTTAETGYINSSDTISGGWESCARRTWCNNVFRNAIPSALRDIFKQHLNITSGGSSNTITTSTDYFALPAEKEVFGSVTFANPNVESNLTQFEYYKTSANRVKKRGDSGSANGWWERSLYSGSSSYFCNVGSGGGAGYGTASTTYMLAPFGCI